MGYGIYYFWKKTCSWRFWNIELGSSLDEIENKLGKPDGWVGGGTLLPVYVLEDNSAVELDFRNDETSEDLEAVYLYKEQKEFILKRDDKQCS